MIWRQLHTIQLSKIVLYVSLFFLTNYVMHFSSDEDERIRRPDSGLAAAPPPFCFHDPRPVAAGSGQSRPSCFSPEYSSAMTSCSVAGRLAFDADFSTGFQVRNPADRRTRTRDAWWRQLIIGTHSVINPISDKPNLATRSEDCIAWRHLSMTIYDWEVKAKITRFDNKTYQLSHLSGFIELNSTFFVAFQH